MVIPFGYTQDGEEGVPVARGAYPAPGAAGETCVTALAVEVSVSRAGSEQPLYTRRTVLDTPNRPRLLTARDAAPGRDTAE